MDKEIKSEEQADVRRTGKVHWHEEIVRPIKVSPRQLIQKDPKNDMLYDGKDRKHRVRDVSLPMRCFNVHISEIPVGGMSRLHKHHNEALIYIIEGKGHSMIQGERYDWEAGDFLYAPPFVWHSHHNDGEEPVYYMGITNKRVLNWLGLDRKVEAGIHMTMEEVEKEIASGDYSPYSWYNIDPEEGITYGQDHRK